jgi:hypothetical protein
MLDVFYFLFINFLPVVSSPVTYFIALCNMELKAQDCDAAIFNTYSNPWLKKLFLQIAIDGILCSVYTPAKKCTDKKESFCGWCL